MTTFSAYTTFWQTVPGIYEYDSFGGISRRRLFVEFTTVTHSSLDKLVIIKFRLYYTKSASSANASLPGADLPGRC